MNAFAKKQWAGMLRDLKLKKSCSFLMMMLARTEMEMNRILSRFCLYFLTKKIFQWEMLLPLPHKNCEPDDILRIFLILEWFTACYSHEGYSYKKACICEISTNEMHLEHVPFQNSFHLLNNSKQNSILNCLKNETKFGEEP